MFGSTIASFVDSSSALAGLLAAVSQELAVLGVFLVSYALWHQLGDRLGSSKRRSQAARKLPAGESPPRGPKKLDSKPGQAEAEVETEVSAVPDEHTKALEAQMLRHLEQHEFTHALNLYRNLGRGSDRTEYHFSEHFYLTFLESAVRVGKTDVVERLLRALRRSHLVPTGDFWRRVLKMLSSRKLFTTCLAVDSFFQRQLPNDKVVWSCLANAALEVGDAQRAASMLDEYSKAGIGVKDHVLFFRTYLALRDADKAEAIFEKLGADTTSLMLNLLLLTCVNTGQPERGLRLLHRAHELEDEARRSSEAPETPPLVDTVSYNTVIKGLAQAGILADCFKCLRGMVLRGLRPDDITFATLLDACIEENNTSAIGEIVSLSTEGEHQLGTVMYTLFIKGLVKANCLPKAMELLDEMKRKADARPDIITYSVLIKALVDQHDLEQALVLVEDMKLAGHAPDDIILTHLLEGCRFAGSYELGKKLFVDILASGVKPSEYSLVTMLKLCGKVGAHQDAHDLVRGWEATYGQKPSVIHYTCLMSGCLRRKQYDLAWGAYELMKSSGVKTDGTLLSTLLPGMVAAQGWDKVLVLAKEGLSLPLRSQVPPETLNNALAHMQAAAGYTRQAAELRELLRHTGILAAKRVSPGRQPSRW